jgi:leader peptidase (prepilin peptidase)/N-methyltransferase
MADNLIPIFSFLFGAVVGSFLNVCIFRIPERRSIVSPASQCPGCGSAIAFYDNIPILSYLILHGRCRACGSRISPQYPLVELIAGVLALLFYVKFGIGVEFFIYFALASALIVITAIDLSIQIIPDVISLPGIGIGLLASFFLPSPGPFSSLLGIITGGGVLFIVAIVYHRMTGVEGMGGGDIKLLAMIGAFTGWKGALFTLFAGSFLGAITGVIAMAAFGKTGRHAIPFGPFLAVGAVFYIFLGEMIIVWYIIKATGV